MLGPKPSVGSGAAGRGQSPVDSQQELVSVLFSLFR